MHQRNRTPHLRSRLVRTDRTPTCRLFSCLCLFSLTSLSFSQTPLLITSSPLAYLPPLHLTVCMVIVEHLSSPQSLAYIRRNLPFRVIGNHPANQIRQAYTLLYSIANLRDLVKHAYLIPSG